MRTYYRTATGYGYTDDDLPEVPESWTVITQEEYEALVAADQQAADDAAAAALAEANARWTTVHDDLVAAGVSNEAAVLLANAVGFPPA